MVRKVLIILAITAIAGFLAAVHVPLPKDDFARSHVQSLRITDRRGILLRECLNDGEGHAAWRSLHEIAPAMVEATIAVEDHRFSLHPGIDPAAILRSIVVNVRSLSFRSGGSTLTQQVIRNVYHHRRTIPNKLLEVWDALRLERMMSKEEILEQYLNRVPYGNQLIGIEAAAQSYFGKPAANLSLAEAAFLAGLPNAPSALNPRKDPGAALARQKIVLARLLAQEVIGQEEYERAVEQPLRLVPAESSIRAAHVTDMMLQRFKDFPSVASIRTTIDYPLQEEIMQIMRSHVATLTGKNVTNAAVVVMDNATGEIRALAGSLDYFDKAHSGEVNGALSLRQPGSAIKPLMYGLAFERGCSPADLLADIPTAIPDHEGEYVPENYDRKFHGPVRLRTALACSYNVPAVRTLRGVGVAPFLDRLREAGITTLNEAPEYYGYGLTLGNGDVTLLELTAAYAALANGGRWKPPVLVHAALSADSSLLQSANDEEVLHPQRQVYDARAAFLVTDVLNDPVARRPAFSSWLRFPFPCAVKTGTTKEYRDNWTMGYTTQYTVGVWVGNFDGSVMHGVSGVSGAGQIFCDVMYLLHTPPLGTAPQPFVVPDGVERREICTVSGKAPGRFCAKTMPEWFMTASAKAPVCDIHRAYRIPGEKGRSGTKVYEIFPPEYAAWVQSERIPVPPPDARPVLEDGTAPASGKRPFAIVSPLDGDCFKLDPVLRREYQTIRIAGRIPDRCSDVRLIIDGAQEMPFTAESARWRLQRGMHTFKLAAMVAGRRVESEMVRVTVE